MVGAALLTIALSSLVMVLISYGQTLRKNRERAMAQEAARDVLERMEALPFEELFASFNADPLDDPDGPGSAPGRRFSVHGLGAVDPLLGDQAGEVRFPVLVPVLGGAAQLREDVQDPLLGMPRDLDGDGAVDGLDHAGDYTLLPVRIRIAWAGPDGGGEFALNHLLWSR